MPALAEAAPSAAPASHCGIALLPGTGRAQEDQADSTVIPGHAFLCIRVNTKPENATFVRTDDPSDQNPAPDALCQP